MSNRITFENALQMLELAFGKSGLVDHQSHRSGKRHQFAFKVESTIFPDIYAEAVIRLWRMSIHQRDSIKVTINSPELSCVSWVATHVPKLKTDRTTITDLVAARRGLECPTLREAALCSIKRIPPRLRRCSEGH